MRGLPLKAQPDDIEKFFEGYDLAPWGAIRLLYKEDGWPSGEAKVSC